MEKSDLQLYCEDVIDDRVVACKKVKSLCKKLLKWIEKPYKRWHFDIEAANRPIRFIEDFCMIPSGRIGPMVLEPYEKAWVQSIFGFVDDEGNRRFNDALVMVARKNGKTSLLAAIELYMLIADNEVSPQIYNAANSLDQANLGFNAAHKMVRQSDLISAHVKKKATPYNQLACDLNFGYIRPLASNASNMDGFDVHCGVCDEIHEWKTNEVYALLKQGMAARKQPLLIEITTNGFVRNGFFDTQYSYGAEWLRGRVKDDRFIAWMYELDDKSEWEDEDCWMKANPGLGTIKSWEYLREQVERAHNDPAYRRTVMTKDFNMPENASVAWLEYDEAVNPARFYYHEKKLRYAVYGADMSDTTDLTCVQAMMMEQGDDHIYMDSMYWIPEAVIDADRDSGVSERDGAPYQTWIERGLMRTCPGNIIDKRVLVEFMREMMEERDVYPFALGYDPWGLREPYLQDEIKAFVGPARVLEVRQGKFTLSAPMKQLQAEHRVKRIVDNDNPINAWCRLNVMVKSDINGNIQPMKKNLDPRNRIDGFAAELDAYVALLHFEEEYRQMA